nr:oligosaccharide flippase family protein [Roseovarius sp. W115]MDV2931249.1 oligosaccharide flippase family protein [Roseovarius sp. W115]
MGKIAHGSLATFAVRLVGLGLGFLQTLILARLLGPESYGQLVAVVSVATLAGWIGVLGLNGLAVREVARLRLRDDGAAEKAFIRFAVLVTLAGALIAASLATYFVHDSLQGNAFWIALIAPTIALMLVFRGVAAGRNRLILSMAPLDVFRPAFFLVAISLLGIAGSVQRAIAFNAVAFVLALIVVTVLLWRSNTTRTKVTPPRAGLLKEALPFFLSGVFFSLQSEMMVLMLTAMSTSDQTGIFQVAFRLSTLLLVVRQAIDVPLSPRFATLWEEGKTAELERLACLSAVISTAAALVILVSFVLLAGPLTGLFGPEFQAAQVSLVILASAQAAFVAAGPLPALLNMADRAGAVTWAMAVAQMVQFGLGFALIPTLGSFGAAIAMSAAILVWALGMWFAAYHYLSVRVSPVRGLAILMKRGFR